jgi:hypothetical protein
MLAFDAEQPAAGDGPPGRPPLSDTDVGHGSLR